MPFWLYEIEGGQQGEGKTFKATVTNALMRASSEGRLTELLLPLGSHDLSRPELPQKVALSVRSQEEAVLAEVFPFKVLRRLGTTAIRANEFRISFLPTPERTDQELAFIEPIFSAVQNTPDHTLRINLFMAVIYKPEKVSD